MWISRDKDNRLWMHPYSKPVIHKYIDCDGNLIERWVTESQIEINSSLFEDLTFENSPKEVILKDEEIPVQYYNDDNKKIVLTLYYADYEKARIKFINQCKQSHLFLQTTPSELTNKFYEEKWLEHQKIEIAVKDIIELRQFDNYTEVKIKGCGNSVLNVMACETKEEIEKL